MKMINWPPFELSSTRTHKHTRMCSTWSHTQGQKSGKSSQPVLTTVANASASFLRTSKTTLTGIPQTIFIVRWLQTIPCSPRKCVWSECWNYHQPPTGRRSQFIELSTPKLVDYLFATNLRRLCPLVRVLGRAGVNTMLPCGSPTCNELHKRKSIGMELIKRIK